MTDPLSRRLMMGAARRFLFDPNEPAAARPDESAEKALENQARGGCPRQVQNHAGKRNHSIAHRCSDIQSEVPAQHWPAFARYERRASPIHFPIMIDNTA